MKNLINAAAIAVFLLVAYAGIWMMANIMYGQAIPPYAARIIALVIYGICGTLVVGVGAGIWWFLRLFRRRRLGIIRFDEYGNLYYVKK